MQLSLDSSLSIVFTVTSYIIFTSCCLPIVPIVPTFPVVVDDVSDEEYSVTYASVPIILTSLVVAD